LNEANKDLAYASNFQDNFTDKAIFGEVTFNVTDVWQITGGFRVFEQDYKVEEQGGLLFAPGGTASTSNSLDTSDQLFKLNTSYRFGDHMIYATWSEGFRRGGANALGAFGTPETALYVPDTVTNYEIGIKGLINDRIEYTVGFFHLDWKNFQLATVCSNFLLLCTVTGGDASSQGIEAEFTAQVSDSLRVMAGYAYVDATLDSPGPALADSPRRMVIPGVQLPGSPKHAGSVTLLYSTELNNDWSLDANATFSYSGEKRSHINELQNTMIDSAGIVNTSIAVSNENWTVRLFASNLFNNTSRLSVASFTVPKKQSVARRPRTVGISVQLRM
jgi:outer membrane receptor for ferric coprogen and ferric-rhodotorulic acid